MGRFLTNYIPLTILALFLCCSALAQDLSPVATECALEVAAATQEPSCQGSTDGRIELAITAATDVEIRWLNLPDGTAVNTLVAENLPAGTYDCELKESGGCTDTLSFNIVDPPELRSEKNEAIVCDKESAHKLFKSITGGRPPYRFSYLAPNDVIAPSCIDCISDFVFVDRTTTFEVTIKDSNGCLDVRTVTITVAPDIEVFSEIDPVQCFGEENASLSIVTNLPENVSNYSLISSTDAVISQSNSNFENLAAGDYTLVVEDFFGCTEERFLNIPEPEELEVAALEVVPVSCPGESDAGVLVSARGGNTNLGYKYSIDGVSFTNVNSFRGLAPGQYDLTVEDGRGCSIVESFKVEEKPTPVIAFQTSEASCPDGDDAAFIVVIETIEGLYEDYNYSIDGELFQRDSIFTDLQPGSYNLIAQSTSGCSFQQTVELSAPPEPEINFAIEEPTCPDGADASFIVVIETIEGLYEDYEYSLDGELFQKDSIFQNLAPGFYNLTTRTDNGCSFEQTIEITAPEAPTISVQTQDVSCPGAGDGAFIVVIETIEGLYEYSLDGELFQKDSIFQELEPGNYTLYVRNQDNCISTQQITINGPGAPQIQIEVQHESCSGNNNGQISIAVAGGDGPFQYSIDGGETFQTSPVFSDLSPGIYTVVVQDAQGCQYSQIINIEGAEALSANFTIGNSSCGYDNGFIASTISGGRFPYTYKWTNGSSNSVAKDLLSGQYGVTITDQSNCQISQDNLLVQDEAAPLLSAVTTDVNCHGENNGAIDLEVESDYPPLSYKWSNGASSQDITGLSSREYTVTVVDGNQCSQSEVFEVQEPELLSIDLEVKQKLGEGFITAEVSGGNGTYRYFWSTGDKQSSLENLPEGRYSVTVVDAQGCKSEASTQFVVQVIKDFRDHIFFFPNPTNGQLTIEFSLPEEQMVSYELIDELGRILLKESVRPVSTEKQYLDLEQLPAAMYFMRINIGNDAIVKKVLKLTR